jgi:hypothetical protein
VVRTATATLRTIGASSDPNSEANDQRHNQHSQGPFHVPPVGSSMGQCGRRHNPGRVFSAR